MRLEGRRQNQVAAGGLTPFCLSPTDQSASFQNQIKQSQRRPMSVSLSLAAIQFHNIPPDNLGQSIMIAKHLKSRSPDDLLHLDWHSYCGGSRRQ